MAWVSFARDLQVLIMTLPTREMAVFMSLGGGLWASVSFVPLCFGGEAAGGGAPAPRTCGLRGLLTRCRDQLLEARVWVERVEICVGNQVLSVFGPKRVLDRELQVR
jgi:hypothetical protein